MFKKKLKLLLLVIGSLILSAIMPIVIFANSSTEPSELKWTSETTVEWKAPSEKPGNQQLLRYQIRIYRNGNIVAGGEGNEIYTRINKYTISESIMSVPGNYRLEVRAQGGFIVGDPDSPTALTYWGEYGNWVGIDSPSASHTHVYGEEWKKDKVQHWKECECGVKSDEAEHTKKVINEKVATTTEDGYTGDTVCEICGYEISKGKVVPMIKEEQKPQGDNKPQEQQKPQEDNKPQEQDKTENNTPQQQENSNKKEDNSTNPQTGDNIIIFSVILAIAVIGLTVSIIITKKKSKNNK